VAFRWTARLQARASDPGSDDWAWLESARRGDDRCATLLVRHLTPQALGMAWQLLGRREEAEDAVQDSYLRLWKSHAQDGHGARLSTYFNTIVINQCRTRMSARRELAVDPAELTLLQDDLQSSQIDVDSEDMRGWTTERDSPVTRALALLPARQRLAVVMWAYADAGIDDIARALDLLPNAAHQLLHRARRSVRDLLSGSKP